MTIFENTFLCKLFIFCILFVNNDKNWDYIVDNIIVGIGLPDYSMTTVQITFPRKLKVCLLLVVNNVKDWQYIVDIIIFGTSYQINIWQSLKTNFYVKYIYLFAYYSGTTTKIENMLLTISYSERLTRLTYDNPWKHISM